MNYTCATCYTVFTTTRSLKRHVRRFHPNTNEEQIICKTCKRPFSSNYYLNLHNLKSHHGEIPTLNNSYIETSEDEDQSNNGGDSTEQEEDEYIELGLCYSGGRADRPKLQESDRKEFLQGCKSETYETPARDDVRLDDESGETETFDNDYTKNLLNLGITQQRNTAFIQQNTLHLLKILEITKELVRDFEAGKEYQAKKLKTKIFNCQTCNRAFGDSASLTTHRYRYHRVKSSTDCRCQQCNSIFSNEKNLAIHNYRFHRASL